MNISIMKRLQIAQNNKKEFKKGIQKFVFMYNVTPHGTTDKSPAKLLLVRRIRNKVSNINETVGEDIDRVQEEEYKILDIVKKQGKERRNEESLRKSNSHRRYG